MGGGPRADGAPWGRRAPVRQGNRPADRCDGDRAVGDDDGDGDGDNGDDGDNDEGSGLMSDAVDGAGGGAVADTVDELRALAERLATSGGEVARRILGRSAVPGLDPRTKSSATDPVTVVDTSVEEHLRAGVAAVRPGDRVLGEEGGEDPLPVDAGGARWIVDPVDGTVNLLYGIPFTAVSVAAEVGGTVVAGAVHNIVTGETWTAGLGRGASLRDRDGLVTELRASGCTELSLALVGTGFSYDSAIRAEQGRVVAGLLPRIRDIRRCGSAALDLCMVATGRLDAYYERCLKPWDHAAGALIAAEAGAVVAVAGHDGVPTTAAAPGVAREFLAALGAPTDPVSS